MFSKKNILKNSLLFIVIALGLYLRIRAAAIQSFWGDESAIFTISIRNSLSSLLLIKHWDKCHPQLFYVFLHFWQMISTKVFFLRIPTLLAFIPAVIFIYKIGKQTSNWLMGILAALFFATSHFFVNLGFQQKMYAFEMAFMFGAIYWMQIALITKNKKAPLFFTIFAILGFYADYSFVWLWAAMWCAMIIIFAFKLIPRKNSSPLFKNMLIATFFMLFQIPIVLSNLTAALGLEAYSGTPNYETVRNTIANYIGLTKLIPYDLLLITITSISALYFAKKNNQKKAILLIAITLLCFFITIPTSYFVSQFHPIFIPRNLLVATFLFIFLVPYVISQIKNKYLKFILIILFLLHVSKALKTSFELEYGFQGLDEFEQIHEIAKNNNNKLLLLVISDENYVLDALHEYYFDGYYDGTEIRGYNEQWIKTGELDDWLAPESLDYATNIIFIAGKEQIENKWNRIDKIRSQMCENKNCYGPFALQGPFKSQ